MHKLQSLVKRLIVKAFPLAFIQQAPYPQGFDEDKMKQYPNEWCIEEGYYFVGRKEVATLKDIKEQLASEFKMANYYVDKQKNFDKLNNLIAYKLENLKLNLKESWENLTLYLVHVIEQQKAREELRKIRNSKLRVIEQFLNQGARDQLIDIFEQNYWRDDTPIDYPMDKWVYSNDWTTRISNFIENTEKNKDKYNRVLKIQVKELGYFNILIFGSNHQFGDREGKFAINIRKDKKDPWQEKGVNLSWEKLLEILHREIRSTWKYLYTRNDNIFQPEEREENEFVVRESYKEQLELKLHEALKATIF